MKGTSVIGYIYSLRMEEDITFNENLLQNLTLYGIKLSTIVQPSLSDEKQTILSKRELQVMRKIVDGRIAKEIASDLGISELTVKQYIKLSIKKLNATNRVHAIAEMFRRGMLF